MKALYIFVINQIESIKTILGDRTAYLDKLPEAENVSFKPPKRRSNEKRNENEFTIGERINRVASPSKRRKRKRKARIISSTDTSDEELNGLVDAAKKKFTVDGKENITKRTTPVVAPKPIIIDFSGKFLFLYPNKNMFKSKDFLLS